MKKMENVADIYPLTPTQQGMLFHTLSAPESEVYFDQIRCTLDGPLDQQKLAEAWQFVVDHHAVLRTAFLWEGLDTPLQIVRQTVTIPWDIHDWRGPTAVPTPRLDALAKQYRQTPFDLARAPLIRLVLVKLGDDAHHFIWNSHHLLLDGWSTYQVFNDAFDVYEMLVRGQRPSLPTVRPFRDYIAWLKKQDLTAAEAAWRRRLAGFTAPTPLTVDRRSSETAVAYADLALELEEAATTAVQTLARQQRVTLNTVVQGAWAVLLSRYSGEHDVVFGNTVSGRPADLRGVEQMVGMFINTLPVRVAVDDDQPLGPWLQQIQAQLVDLRELEYSPLVQVQQWSDVPPGQPLFESIIVFENFPLEKPDPARSLQRGPIRFREQSNYPLALLVLPGDRLRLQAIYDRHRFDAATIERLLGHLRTLLEAMAARPSQSLANLTLLTPAERRQLLLDWNATAVPITPAQCLHAFVADHAAQTPDATAVIATDARLTYAELDARANRLARRLIEQGITPGTPVGLYAERSAAMLVGIVGILKAGGAYVPLDPAYPAERTAFVLNDTRAPLVVTQAHLAAQLPPSDATVLTLDVSDARLGSAPDDGVATAVTLDHPAYIIYTSGSTGTPKGVVVSHRNLLASTLARETAYDAPVGRFLLLSSFAFDSSVAGLFWSLLQGGALVLPATDEEKEVDRLAALISQEQVTHTLALPSLYRLLLDFAPPGSLDSLQVVIVAGEACPPDLNAAHHGRLPHTALYNEYGPTEATVWCSVYRLPRIDAGGPVPIGRPIANSQLLILDPRRQPAPIGVPGELYVGGAGVTAGYHNRPDLTADRFVTLPLPEVAPDARFYRTGDLARWRADGELEFLGRVDNQVKVRGYRIELGEIEAVLQRHAAVAEAAVVVWEPGGQPASGKRLVAYVVADGGRGLDPATLQTFVASQLPDYMVPAVVVPLAALPRIPNGKVDRSRLPEPDATAVRQWPFTPPRTAAEQTLATIWADVLRLPQVGIHDTFFELGGDSILSIQVIARARQAGLSLTPRQIFTEQTIARLAAAADAASDDVADAAIVTGTVPLSPIQRWFFASDLTNPAHWNQAAWFEMTTAVNPTHLAAALTALAGHHPMLRARFRQTPDGWQQEILERVEPITVERVSLADRSAHAQDAALVETANRWHASLDLAQGPLLRAVLVDLGPERPPRLLLILHHLIVDAVSWGTLTADLTTAYARIAAGQSLDLPAPTAVFPQWSQGLARLAETGTFAADAAYWQGLSSITAVSLPADGDTDTPNTEGHAHTLTVALDAETTSLMLRDANHTYNTRVDDLLLAALLRAANGWTGAPSLWVTLERHGREEIDPLPDMSQVVGWFTALFPVALTLQGQDDLGANLRGVKEQLRAVPRSGLSYGVLRYLADESVRGQMAALPQPEILFNYLGQVDGQTPSGRLFRPLTADIGQFYGASNGRAHAIDVNAEVVDGRLQMVWQAAPRFRPATIQRLAQAYLDELTRLVYHCVGRDDRQFTPSDFPLSQLAQDDLDSLTDLLGQLD